MGNFSACSRAVKTDPIIRAHRLLFPLRGPLLNGAKAVTVSRDVKYESYLNLC